MKPTPREPYHHGDLRNALLQAALELVREKRSTHFSLRDLAERVGVTQPAIYRHFTDLDDVLSTLCRDGFDAFGKAERQMLTKASDPWARLRPLIRVYVHFATNNPAYFRIMFDSGFANRSENIGRARSTFQYLVDVIAEIGGSRDGAFEKAVATWASMHGLSALMLSGQLGAVLKKPARAARLEQTVTELIERGLGRPREAPTTRACRAPNDILLLSQGLRHQPTVEAEKDMPDHSHTAPPSDPELRIKALESLLVEKQLIDPDAVDAIIDTYETKIGPRNGAKVVARAWVDPEYRARLLADATKAIAELGFSGVQGEDMVVVENTDEVHNVVVCTLCSCYPWPTLGLPPIWYKAAPYRARVVRDPRGVLLEFGTRISDDVEVRVWDSNAELRYLVLPQRPAGTEGWTEEQLAELVSRDAMIGTAIVQPLAQGAAA